MDECLPLDSLDASALRVLLERERVRRAALEQEVARLQAGLDRQNGLLIALQQRDRKREEQLGAMRELQTSLVEQNTLLRQEVAALGQENARLRETPLAAPPDPEPKATPATPQREAKVRRKRAGKYNAGRRQTERATRWETHAAKTCPRCGEQLSGGWVVRRVQVIDLPVTPPLEVTQHRIIRRACPKCGKQVLPKPVGIEAGRIGQSRFGPRLIAAMATMATVERLPIRIIQERLRREYGLVLSVGGIIGLLQRVARAAQPVYAQVQAEARASPVIHADETGWRENGQHTTIWTVSTPQVVYLAHGRRTSEAIDTILGADFAGTIVADCYAAYDHFLGPKQRCWAHLVRDLKGLLAEYGEDVETVAWVTGILKIYQRARQVRSAGEEGASTLAVRARERRARQYEALIGLLCPDHLDPAVPYATLAKRLRRYCQELFTFVRDPQVAATNNAAERSLRHLVVIRKVSGGARSLQGSEVRVILCTVYATARVQGKDPTAVYQEVLLMPPGAPSPLTVPVSVP